MAETPQQSRVDLAQAADALASEVDRLLDHGRVDGDWTDLEGALDSLRSALRASTEGESARVDLDDYELLDRLVAEYRLSSHLTADRITRAEADALARVLSALRASTKGESVRIKRAHWLEMRIPCDTCQSPDTCQKQQPPRCLGYWDHPLTKLGKAVETALRYFDGEVVAGLRDGRHTREVAANITEHQVRNLRWALEATAALEPAPPSEQESARCDFAATGVSALSPGEYVRLGRLLQRSADALDPASPTPTEARGDLEWAFRLMRDCLQTGKKPEDYEQDRLDEIADALTRPTPTEQEDDR